MKDKKEVCRELWESLDIAFVKFVFMIMVFAAIFCLILAKLEIGHLPTVEQVVGATICFAITGGPMLIFCLWRIIQIFRCPESYHFCKTKLSSPKGGSIRDTIKFTVVVEDADGDKFVADTHSIFTTHRGFPGLALEDYINQTVTVAYNEETGILVVIG